MTRTRTTTTTRTYENGELVKEEILEVEDVSPEVPPTWPFQPIGIEPYPNAVPYPTVPCGAPFVITPQVCNCPPSGYIGDWFPNCPVHGNGTVVITNNVAGASGVDWSRQV